MEEFLVDLAAFGHAEKFRQGAIRRVGFKAFHGIRRQDQHTMGRFPAEAFLPAIGDDIELCPVDVLAEGGRGRVADHNPVRVRLDPVGVRDAHAGCGAVPGEDDVGIIAGLGEVRQLAVIGIVSVAVKLVGVVATINFLSSKSDELKLDPVIVVKLSNKSISPGTKLCALEKVNVTVGDPLVVLKAFVSVVVV